MNKNGCLLRVITIQDVREKERIPVPFDLPNTERFLEDCTVMNGLIIMD